MCRDLISCLFLCLAGSIARETVLLERTSSDASAEQPVHQHPPPSAVTSISDKSMVPAEAEAARRHTKSNPSCEAEKNRLAQEEQAARLSYESMKARALRAEQQNQRLRVTVQRERRLAERRSSAGWRRARIRAGSWSQELQGASGASLKSQKPPRQRRRVIRGPSRSPIAQLRGFCMLST